MSDYRKKYEKETGFECAKGIIPTLEYVDWLESRLSEAETKLEKAVKWITYSENVTVAYWDESVKSILKTLKTTNKQKP